VEDFVTAAHRRVSTALGLDRRAILIGVDGRDGHGKTSAVIIILLYLIYTKE